MIGLDSLAVTAHQGTQASRFTFQGQLFEKMLSKDYGAIFSLQIIRRTIFSHPTLLPFSSWILQEPIIAFSQRAPSIMLQATAETLELTWTPLPQQSSALYFLDRVPPHRRAQEPISLRVDARRPCGFVLDLHGEGEQARPAYPKDWVEDVRRRVEAGREFQDAVREVLAANAQLLVLARKQRRKTR